MENKNLKYGFVYITINKLTGKKYVGKCVYSRINSWEKYLGSGVYLKRAINKYGKENFYKIIIDECDNEKELREVEEYYILMFDAVNSKDFYNIKLSSIGGDVFTGHPNKEGIRQMRVDQMSGSGNHQYGKPKSQKMINSVKEANSKKCIINSIEYESITEAAKKLGYKSKSGVLYKLKSEKYPDWKYA